MMPPSNLFYFAFGSNMWPGQMQARCPSATQVCTARLDGYQIVFNRKGRRWPGAVASIQIVEGESVHGVVWNLSEGDAAILDQIEHPKSYERIPIVVDGNDEGLLPCFAYRAYPNPECPPPDPDYLDIILKAARSQGLPPGYVRHLESFASCK